MKSLKCRCRDCVYAVRLPLAALLLICLTACDLVMTDPTRTPTPFMPPLVASPTVNPRPPTPDPLGQTGQGGSNNPTAAAVSALSGLEPGTPAPDENRPLLISVTLPDGTVTNGEYYADENAAPAPGVLVLAVRLEDWEGFSVRLRDAGFSVLLVETRTPQLEGDFRAMLDTISLQPSVDAGAIAVIGAANSADTALIGCANDARCTTAILLSPQLEQPLVNAMRSGYNPRPLLLSASLDDPASLQVAEAVRRIATGDVVLQPFEGEWQGTQILVQRPEMNDFIIQWLRRYLIEARP